MIRGGTEVPRAAGMKAAAARTFASDNWAGVHPDVLAAVVAANVDHVPAYGADAADRARR